MNWLLSHRFDPYCLALANRHYSRQKPASPQFVPPGRCVVLRTRCGRALWVSSWQEYAFHAWPGAWVCCLFRNEGAGLSSDLIRDAVAVTRHVWQEVPALGMITFIDAEQIRHKRDPGRCYKKAGFRPATPRTTGKGLLVLQLLPADMPDPVAPFSYQSSLLLDEQATVC